MNLTYLKKTALFLALVFILQGCALYVRDNDRYEHHHRHYYHDRGGWR